MSNRRAPVAILASLLAAAGCLGQATLVPSAPPSATAAPSTTPVPVELTIFGAASLKDVLAEIEAAYEAATGARLTISTGSSAALETQIEQGAPADVLLAADTANPQKLVDAGLAEGQIVPVAGNRLSVIVPSANPAAIRSPADLATPGVKIIAAGDEVPITKYAGELVANLALEPGYPADFAAAYAANIVSKEEDVKSVVAKIEIGEGDAGIVYATDATTSTEVASIVVPDSANVMARYAGVVVKASAEVEAATMFLDWLVGPDGQAILADFGFTPVS
jgi:molybdate transport system substrate-binding protein